MVTLRGSATTCVVRRNDQNVTKIACEYFYQPVLDLFEQKGVRRKARKTLSTPTGRNDGRTQPLDQRCIANVNVSLKDGRN